MSPLVLLAVSVILASIVGGLLLLRRYIRTLDAPASPIWYRERPGGTGFWRLGLGLSTCYLLSCKGGWLLIDTAFLKDYSRFLSAIEEAHIDPTEVKYVLLTHRHDDHVGFAGSLAKEFGTAVLAHEQCFLALDHGIKTSHARPLKWFVPLTDLGLALFMERGPVRAALPPQTERMVLKEDAPDVLRELGIPATILSTPGHTSDSISVLLDDGSLFSGDAACNLFNAIGADYRPVYVADRAELIASWRKVLDCGAMRVYPAHGLPFEAAELKRSMAKHEGG
jgi:glyoxylase-like metal-dependent hydrolase (beta-lactamase superfamily II)